MKIISNSATLINQDGLIAGRGLLIADNGDTIIIGVAEHSKSDLEIASHTIRSKAGGWEVQMDSVMSLSHLLS